MNEESRDQTEAEGAQLSARSSETAGTPEEENAKSEADSEKTEPSLRVTGEKQGESADSEGELDTDRTEAHYRELAEKAEKLVEHTDWSYVSMEFANIKMKWEEGPDPEGLDISDYRSRVDSARDQFEEKKKVHIEEQRRIRQENLDKKKELLDELKKIIDEKQWTATREVGRIRNRWDQIKPVPADSVEELQMRYDRLVEEFENHKVDRIVRKKEKEEENLVGKLAILDKMELLIRTVEQEEKVDWEPREKELDKFNRQWHKIGRVPSEKNQEIWQRFHDIQSRFHDIRFSRDTGYRNRIESYLKKKQELIREAEALVDSEDLPSAARRVNKLHRLWKKAGNLPQTEENELWDRFKEATDQFNALKAENIEKLRRQEQENLNQREALIQKAEEMKDSEDWEETHQAYQRLMEEWKQTGPVPKRVSGKVWKRLKKAMDHFYDRRREHFKEIRKKRKSNLDEKREVLGKLRELVDHENPIKAVELAKPLQEEFKKAGYVPIKFKNQIWKEYREICDEIYGRYRAARSVADVVGEEEVSDYSKEDLVALQKHRREAGKLQKDIDKLNRELIQIKESLSYFKPTGQKSSLLESVYEKVEAIEKKIQQKEKRLEEIEKEMDRLADES